MSALSREEAEKALRSMFNRVVATQDLSIRDAPTVWERVDENRQLLEIRIWYPKRTDQIPVSVRFEPDAVRLWLCADYRLSLNKKKRNTPFMPTIAGIAEMESKFTEALTFA